MFSFKSIWMILILFPVFCYPQNGSTFADGLIKISEYIANSGFERETDIDRSLSQIDSIYCFALKTFNYDYSEAMFCLTFVLLPYKTIPLQTPFFKLRIDILLPVPDDRLFKIRYDNLPKNLFIDSPLNSFGDKDKLSHFFGNAFLSYGSSVFNISKFMGMFVEIFENTFKIDGKLDLRDFRANNLGELFGSIITKNNRIMPSRVFKLYTFFYYSCFNNFR